MAEGKLTGKRTKRLPARFVNQLKEWQHTAECKPCKESFTWNGKIPKGQVSEVNYVCRKCGKRMKVFNHRRNPK